MTLRKDVAPTTQSLLSPWTRLPLSQLTAALWKTSVRGYSALFSVSTRFFNLFMI
ncbi:hypothetical protein [Lactobacillus delbrueckii]|uniref:hypothetical protein n=1 Tax=Lactobacillus delbrueckii TaxID=1584 RepID=UPI000ADDC986|nr:hypothetical protein [Lactobacillus delbrueckii]